MRVGRSASGGLGEAGGSPSARRKPGARLLPVVDSTVFRVPGLLVKVHYESRTLPDESASPAAARTRAGKKAALFAWITLRSIPEETIISPHILEFLERALEPIPAKALSLAPPVLAARKYTRGVDSWYR